MDDKVSQLELGSISALFPLVPPSDRTLNSTGRTGRENLWCHALAKGFPSLDERLLVSWSGWFPASLPAEVQGGYAIGHAVERLRRLRDRISHHEPILGVNHRDRLKDVSMLARCVDLGAAHDLRNLDRVRRTLALRPR
ncbi:hypothetical protein SCB71_04380 [Herbiconiux sp. KACC 21604]|uniref:hypothetical protein n=1 Tax=unclassified Herbiconiux TaxID=2618217 RepID=UPI001491A974|nr:hypothetical protein [Herbiconiux sp. SALV-R1]QJU52596.1 hypothetical protein HL652_02345 [Herbiconiux sp. SALV-R1]WPO87485.1 hypothetical protein SCB71_04380 [Herbiconiux sp. KACC 21604]